MFISVQNYVNLGMENKYSENELLNLLKNEDKVAQEEFVKKYYNNMFSIATRYLGNREDVEDCLQESFLAAIKYIDTFEGKSTIKTWLTSIVINKSLMKLRSRQKRDEISIDQFLPTFDSDGFRIEPEWNISVSTDELVQKKRNKEIVGNAIKKLPEDYKAVLLLRDIDGYSTTEVAEMLNLTESNVKSRLHRARSVLKKLLEGVFGE